MAPELTFGETMMMARLKEIADGQDRLVGECGACRTAVCERLGRLDERADNTDERVGGLSAKVNKIASNGVRRWNGKQIAMIITATLVGVGGLVTVIAGALGGAE